MQYTIIRTKRKTMALQVNAALEVIVRAPVRTSLREIDRFVAANRAWVENQFHKQQERAARYPTPTEEDLRALKAAAKAYLPQRVAYYANLMGLQPAGIKITAAKTRFGSCSGKNSLCFSCLLMRYPKEAIDYVVVHELAHIPYKNHGEDFYRLVERFMPDYKARRRLLKGQE